MVKVFGNRKWLLESKLEPKTKWFLVSPTVVRCQSFETKKEKKGLLREASNWKESDWTKWFKG